MLKEPESVAECVYFTNRIIKNGKARAWVLREKCPKCNNALMGKPRGENGKIKIRAKEYVCPSCDFTMGEEEYEDTLICNLKYTCPYCKHEDEAQAPFKRKKAVVLRFQCKKCSKNIDITKRMKEI